jgi:hypothetical protein
MAATTVSEVYDAVLTTTARYENGRVTDNISKSNKLIAWLIGNGRKREVSGGERIKVALMYQQNSGADIYSGYGQLQTDPQDGITAAFFPWSQMSVPITISGLERRQNNGEEAIINLLDTKMMQSEISGTEMLNNCIVNGRIASGATGNLNQFSARRGILDPSVSGPLPIPALVDASPTRSVSIGSINGNSETWWENQAVASSASTYAGFKQEMNNLYNTCRRGTGGPPNLGLCDQKTWEIYFGSLHNQERYYVTNPRIINILGGAEEDMLKFRGLTLVWDEVVPDVGTSTADVVDSIGTYGSDGTMYMINSNNMEYIVHPDANWTQTPFITPVNQDATVAHLLWQGQLCVNNRRKNGVLYDIDLSIAA